MYPYTFDKYTFLWIDVLSAKAYHACMDTFDSIHFSVCKSTQRKPKVGATLAEESLLDTLAHLGSQAGDRLQEAQQGEARNADQQKDQA
jgi:hypothetical protein